MNKFNHFEKEFIGEYPVEILHLSLKEIWDHLDGKTPNDAREESRLKYHLNQCRDCNLLKCQTFGYRVFKLKIPRDVRKFQELFKTACRTAAKIVAS